MTSDEDKVPDEAAETRPEPVRVGRPPKPLSQQVGRVAMFVAGGIFVVFALSNFDHVDFSWVFGKTEVQRTANERISGGVPLIVLLLAAFVLGNVVGAGMMARRQTRKTWRQATKTASKGKDEKRA